MIAAGIASRRPRLGKAPMIVASVAITPLNRDVSQHACEHSP
jgi:hypothetical protein